jgi:NAD(P)-dependent dehydrogenase (short-subunit alcohol dehydrogenase family)
LSGKYNSFLEKAIIPRFGRPSDVARAIVFFLEQDSYLTGQILAVDGGLITKM